MPTRTSKENIAALQKAKEELLQGGGAERVAKQHNEGKLTARERLEFLLDRDTFQETGLFAQHRATLFGMADKPLPADGVVTGSGKVGGRTVHVASQDFTVAGGSAGEVHGSKISESLQPFARDRHAVRVHQRFRRRARAGRRRQPGRATRRSSTTTSCSPAWCRRSRSSAARARAARPIARRSPISSSRPATPTCSSPARRSSSR